MTRDWKSAVTRTMLLPLLASLSLAGGAFGCAGAAVAGAGAVGAIAYTDRGAKGVVKGDVQQVDQKTRTAFQNMGIQISGTQTKEAGKERELSGKSKTTDVTVNMTQAAGGTTQVEVIARESTFKWNKDYAKEVLTRIVKQG